MKVKDLIKSLADFQPDDEVAFAPDRYGVNTKRQEVNSVMAVYSRSGPPSAPIRTLTIIGIIGKSLLLAGVLWFAWVFR
jgi:hypothetical protein